MAGDSWPALPADTASTQWAAIVLLTALLLAVVVLLQTATSYARAYSAAPLEITSFLDAVDYSVQENETYDLDISRARRLDDKVRLSRLLREIQRAGDDLREDISRLLISETDPRLRISARLLWASKRRGLEERVRRLDMLRMRFLVVYMGILSAHALGGDKEGRSRGPGEKETKYIPPAPPLRPEALPRALTLPPPKKAAPTRRITTDAIGHSNTPAKNHKQGWAGVVEELRRSPLMHKRHASIETAMSDQRSS